MSYPDFEWSLFATSTAAARQGLTRTQTPSQLQWTHDVAEFAQSGTPPAIVLALAVIWTIASIARQQYGKHAPSRPPPSSTPWPYEALSQACRAASVTLLTVACVRRGTHPLNAAAATYGFALGLLRLTLPPGRPWHRAALHQVNCIFTAIWALLLVAQYLPCVGVGDELCSGSGSSSRDNGTRGARDPVLSGALASLSAGLAVAVATPRQWVPPSRAVRDELAAAGEAGDQDDVLDYDEEGGVRTGSPEETCSWLSSYCTYGWLTPFVWKGTGRSLTFQDMPAIPWYDDPTYLLHRLQRARAASRSTMTTILRFQRTELLLMAFFASLAYALENVAPLSMFRLLAYLADPEDSAYRPWVWLLLAFVGPMARSFMFHRHVFHGTRLIVRIKSSMIQELYHKALGSMEVENDPSLDAGKAGKPGKAGEAPPHQKTTSAGRLSTLMAADIDSIYRGRDITLVIFGVSTGTAVSAVGLYRMLGWPSLVGLAVLMLGVPLSTWISRLIYGSQTLARRAQDSRISLVTEYLASIRAIKYFAWEAPVADGINAARAREQRQLWHVAVLQVLVNQVSQAFPLVALIVMFGLYAGVNRARLDASTAFTSLLLIKNIRRNMTQASQVVRNFSAAMVAFKRFDQYFDSAIPKTDHPAGPLRICNATFSRSSGKEDPAVAAAAFRLRDVSVDFVEGGLNVVSGPSGSGKTTLLLSILGETYLEAGTVTRPPDVAFASQSAWLQNDTIQANILFDSPMDRTRYNHVVEACCLPADLAELARGDMTTVGENGASLSGGQKARVALARALYSRAPLILLDDVFSALDAKTAAALWERCFCTDMLKGRTTVLVTQIPWIPEQADLSVTLDNGRVAGAEPNIGAVRRPVAVADQPDDDYEEEQTNGHSTDPVATTQSANGHSKGKNGARDLVEQEIKESGKTGRLMIFQYMSFFDSPAITAASVLSLLLTGLMSFYSSYWLSVWVEAYKAGAHVDIAYYMGMYAALSVSELALYAVSVVMFEWGAWRAARRLHGDFVTAVLGVSLSWFQAVPAGRIANRFAGDVTSIDTALGPMVRSAFENATQLFFRVAAVSSILPIFMLPAVATCVVGMCLAEMYTRTAVVTKRILSSTQSPVFSQFGDTLAGLAVIRARAGMPRAFGRHLAAKVGLMERAAEANYNCNRWVSVRLDFVTALVTLFAGAIAVSKVGTISAGLVGFSLSNATGLSQIILHFVRNMNELEVEMQSFHRVNEYIKLAPEDQDDHPYPEEPADGTQATAPYTDTPGQVIPRSWPASGTIELRNVTVRYDPLGPDILTDVNLTLRAGERVAVVGRTGSGKSTLVLSLLQFTHVVRGSILYDGVDITRVPRRRLRKAVTVIPQEATLFSGTVRSNLDPSGTVGDDVLARALARCESVAAFATPGSTGPPSPALTPTAATSTSTLPPEASPAAIAGSAVASYAISLDSPVDARGTNFSHGQRQVLSLCRALVRDDAKLMLLDEATASMDYDTDRAIQTVLRDVLAAPASPAATTDTPTSTPTATNDTPTPPSPSTPAAGATAPSRTLVTIAHRLRTIIDYDRVVVMSAGRVVENGSPAELYRARGPFYEMVRHSGEMDALTGLLHD